jgi:hypothetical protein
VIDWDNPDSAARCLAFDRFTCQVPATRSMAAVLAIAVSRALVNILVCTLNVLVRHPGPRTQHSHQHLDAISRHHLTLPVAPPFFPRTPRSTPPSTSYSAVLLNRPLSHYPIAAIDADFSRFQAPTVRTGHQSTSYVGPCYPGRHHPPATRRCVGTVYSYHALMSPCRDAMHVMSCRGLAGAALISEANML